MPTPAPADTPWVTWSKDRPDAGRAPRYQYKLADSPDWTVVGLEVQYPPNGATPPHKHGGASVIGLVLEGEILSAMNKGEAHVYKAGESWYEEPGCLHRISENFSSTNGAKLLATFIIKTEVLEREGPQVLVQIEPEYLAQLQG